MDVLKKIIIMLKIKKDRKWYLFDARDKVLGRLATKLVYILSGKHKVDYVPYLDRGDHCIVLNAGKVFVTGRKRVDKKYYHHTGYPGGIKVSSFSDMLVRSPEKIIEIAVRGMLPKGSLGRMMYRKLKVYSGSEHPHSAQQPHQIFDEITNNDL